MSVSKIPIVGETVLCRIEDRIRREASKQYEDLLILHSVFGSVLQRAFDILEKYPTLEKYTTTNDIRSLIEINGENDRCYRVFPRINFCPCQAFKHQVIEKKLQLTCKHVLAARIAMILDRIVEQKVTTDQYLMLLHSMFNTNE